jgi:hypothetical protein
MISSPPGRPPLRDWLMLASCSRPRPPPRVPPGPTSGLLKPLRSVPPPSSGSASGSSRLGWKRPWAASRRTGRGGSGRATAEPRPTSSPGPARRRRRVAPRGRGNCWLTSSSRWKSWSRSPTRPCGERSKKRAEAVADGAMVPTTGVRRRVRGGEGGRPGGLPPPLRPQAAAGRPRRGA